ncbi:MAG TPA: SDR family oxidoreductase [Aldersonia sp.]
MQEQHKTALVTGASAGLGRALSRELVRRGWRVIGTARRADRLREVAGIVALPGDVADPAHRTEIAAAVRELGRLDLLVNNASRLGPSPLPRLADLDPAELARIQQTNVVAPLALVQALLPWLREAGGVVLNVSSDAAVAAYEGWGGYGSSKAALDQLSAVLGVELPDMRVYAVDPGDMRTEMHQAAFPGEDISDRPEPETVVPALLTLVEGRPPSGRYLASEIRTAQVGVSA